MTEVCGELQTTGRKVVTNLSLSLCDEFTLVFTGQWLYCKYCSTIGKDCIISALISRKALTVTRAERKISLLSRMMVEAQVKANLDVTEII